MHGKGDWQRTQKASTVIKQRIRMARSAVECPCVVTTAFYSQAQWCFCAAEPSWLSRKPQSSLHSPTSSETQTSAHRPPFYFGIYSGNCLYPSCQITISTRICSLLTHSASVFNSMILKSTTTCLQILLM